MSLRKRIIAFWDFFVKHETPLKRYAKGKSTVKVEEQKQRFEDLSALARAIHPDLTLELYWSDSIWYLIINFPFPDAPHLYYIQRMLYMVFPKKLEDKDWRMQLGVSHCHIKGYEITPEWEPQLMTCLAEDKPAVVQLYSDSLDLHNPDTFYQVQNGLRLIWGEAFTELFVNKYEVVDSPLEQGRSPLDLVREHASRAWDNDSGPYFSIKKFDPFEYPASYDLPIGLRGLRRKGTICYPRLLGELEPIIDGLYHPLEEQANIRAFERAGISVISLQFHYPENITRAYQEAREISDKVAECEQLLAEVLEIGDAIGGELEDVYILDYLCGDKDALIAFIRPFVEQGGCLVELIDHTAPIEERTTLLFDPNKLPVEEMEQRNVASIDMLAALDVIGEKTVEQRLIEARALNGTERYEEAIAILEGCRSEAQGDPRLYYGFAHAYRNLAQLQAENALTYGLLARDNYLEAISLGYRQTEARAMLAQLYFTHDLEGKGGDASYLKGLEYLSQAKQDVDGFELLQDYFFNDNYALITSDRMALEREMQARYGKPSIVSQILLPEGLKFEVQYYEASPLSKDHPFVLTRGISDFIIGSPYVYYDDPNNSARMEHLIVLPKGTDVFAVAKDSEHWVTKLLSYLGGFYILYLSELGLGYFDNMVIKLQHLEAHPYTGHSSVLFRTSPTYVFKRASDRQPIKLPSGAEVSIVSLTPMYDEEALLLDCYDYTDLKARGLFKVPHYPDPKRPNLGAKFDFSDVDFDELDSPFGNTWADS